MTEAFIESFAASLFSMLNPIGAVGIFAAMTAGREQSEVKKIAITCTLAVVITLLVITWGGHYILSFFGISIPALQAAGGLIILLIGLNMLMNKSEHKTSNVEIEESHIKENISIVPLAIPIIAGPGAMATVLVTTAHHSTFNEKIEISATVLVISLITGIFLLFANKIAKQLGKSGMGVVTRIMGLILAAMAMSLLSEGLTSLFPGLS